MDLRTLRSFVAVAEELHFTRAAERLHIAQPALSQQIRHLEKELGVQLLERTKRSVRLTEPGRLLVVRSRQLLEDAEAARLEAERAGRGEVGQLTISFTPAARDLVPASVRRFRAKFPAVEIELRQSDPRSQVNGLERDEIQIALIHDRVDRPRFANELVRTQRFVVALASDHPLASRRSIALAELRDDLFIMGPSGVGAYLSGNYLRAFMTACGKAGFTPSISHQAPDIATRLTFIAAGIGVAVVLETNRMLETGDVVYVPLSGPPINVELFAVWREDLHSPLVASFLQVLRGEARTLRRTARSS